MSLLDIADGINSRSTQDILLECRPALMSMLQVLQELDKINKWSLDEYFIEVQFTDECRQVNSNTMLYEIHKVYEEESLEDRSDRYLDFISDVSIYPASYISCISVGLLASSGENILAWYSLEENCYGVSAQFPDFKRPFTKIDVSSIKRIVSAQNCGYMIKYDDSMFIQDGLTDEEICSYYRDCELVDIKPSQVEDFVYMIAPEFLRDAEGDSGQISRIMQCSFQFAIPETPPEYMYKDERPLYLEHISRLQNALELSYTNDLTEHSARNYLREIWLDESTCLDGKAIAELLTSDKLLDTEKANLQVKILSERLAQLKEYVDRYVFDKEKAIIELATKFSNCIHYDHPTELKRLGVRKFFEEFMKQKGIDYTYALLLQQLQEDWWELNKDIDVDAEWVSPNKEEGRPKTSEVYNSSFWEYHYYRVTVKLEGVEWSEILRGQTYFNGGWN